MHLYSRKVLYFPSRNIWSLILDLAQDYIKLKQNKPESVKDIGAYLSSYFDRILKTYQVDGIVFWFKDELYEIYESEKFIHFILFNAKFSELVSD